MFPCPKLTPLQSRFVASLAALLLLGLIYWSLSNPHFAYAAELEIDGRGRVRDKEDHNWHRIERDRLVEDGIDMHVGEEEGVDRRAPTANAIGANNAPVNLNIQAGNTTLWVYNNNLLMSPHAERGAGLPSTPGVARDLEVQHAELRRRQQQSGETRRIYVSINTCLQPEWNGTAVQTAAPPQLTLFVATRASNTNPGPAGDASSQVSVPLQEGWANASVRASGDWYMSVHAPSLPSGFVGSWNYELAVSIDDYYHSADTETPFLSLVDTDSSSALLVTQNLTQVNATSTSAELFKQWMALSPPPFVMFAANVNHTSTMGIMNSYCGWRNAAQISASQRDVEGTDTNVQMGMIIRGIDNMPKEQFYITRLNASSSYVGVLALDGNSTDSGSGVVGGGGKIWQPLSWKTQTSGSCALLFNLTFCDEVAYAVPSNPRTYPNISDLRQLFDNYTSTSYQAFNYSLQQIPCNTTSDAQYSLAKNCTDCAAAYKEWLCAVSIPRCEEFSLNTSEELHRQPRNMGQPFFDTASMLPASVLNASYTPMPDAPTIPGSNAYQQTYFSSNATRHSRNPLIDQSIQPGPYNEVLPCEDLCYNLVASCPASLQFACPYRGRGLEAAYAPHLDLSGQLSCNYPGAVYPPEHSAGADVLAPVFRVLTLMALVALVVGVA